MSSGPLSGVRVIEMGSIGPGPYCGMLLAEMGADVVRIDRPDNPDLGLNSDPKLDFANRSKRSIVIDLRTIEGVATAARLIAQSDVAIEGFRPGVMERLGLGPIEMLTLNPRLIYGRMTGWGQEGALAHAVGHDINYIALSGALHAIGSKDGGPVVPLNLVGDFGGGSLFLAMGVVAALYERSGSNKGQVIDAAMVDGVSSLMTSAYSSLARGSMSEQRGMNALDGGAPWYTVYETADGKHVSIGSIEKRFYAELLRRTGLDGTDLPAQHDKDGWPQLHQVLSKVFKTKTRDQWCKEMEGSDVCFAPVLSMSEVRHHTHMAGRSTIVEVSGIPQPNSAPRFSRTPSAIKSPPAEPGQHTPEVLAFYGFSEVEIDRLKSSNAVR